MNECKFHAIVELGIISKMAPSGSRGRRIIFTPDAIKVFKAQAIGVPVYMGHSVKNYAKEVISGEIIGHVSHVELIEDMLYINGIYIPNESLDIQANSSSVLGISYEIHNVEIVDMTNARIWTVKKLTLQGFGVLKQRNTAYRENCLFWLD